MGGGSVIKQIIINPSPLTLIEAENAIHNLIFAGDCLGLDIKCLFDILCIRRRCQ